MVIKNLTTVTRRDEFLIICIEFKFKIVIYGKWLHYWTISRLSQAISHLSHRTKLFECFSNEFLIAKESKYLLNVPKDGTQLVLIQDAQRS